MIGKALTFACLYIYKCYFSTFNATFDLQYGWTQWKRNVNRCFSFCIGIFTSLYIVLLANSKLMHKRWTIVGPVEVMW